MPPVSSHQEIRSRGFGTFQKAIVALVGRNGESRRGHDQSAVLPDLRHGFRNFSRQNWKLGPAQNSFIFQEDRHGDEKPKAKIESKFENAKFQPKRAEVCRNQDIGVKND